MDEMKKTAVQLPRGRQRPIKTEWNSRCVIFTYFQGDISSVVDEHFSRALRNIKRPPALNPSRQHEDVILRNGELGGRRLSLKDQFFEILYSLGHVYICQRQVTLPSEKPHFSLEVECINGHLIKLVHLFC
jgi:hypothetical protein